MGWIARKWQLFMPIKIYYCKAGELGVSYRVLKIFDQHEDQDVTRELENLYSLVEMLQGPEYVDFIRTNTEKLLGKN